MKWRASRGFASGGLAVKPDDLARIEGSGDGEYAIVIANASSAAFEHVAPALSRTLIDAALAAWRGNASPAESIEHATSALSKTSAESPTGWMLFAHVGADIEVAWIGLEEAWLLDGASIAMRTTPHSLRAQLATAPDVATRSLPDDAPDAVTWQRIPGSRLVCASTSVARIDANEVIALAGSGDLDICARELAEAAVRVRPGRPAAVVIAEAG